MTHTLHSAWANRLECKCGIRHQQIGNYSCATDPQSKDFILSVHSPYQSRVCGQKSLLGDTACTDYTDSGECGFLVSFIAVITLQGWLRAADAPLPTIARIVVHFITCCGKKSLISTSASQKNKNKITHLCLLSNSDWACSSFSALLKGIVASRGGEHCCSFISPAGPLSNKPAILTCRPQI